MPAVLIDTNILVYASDPGEETRQNQAVSLLRFLDTTKNGRLSVQCLAEFVNVATRSVRPLYTRAEVGFQVERLARTYPVFDLTPMIVLEADRGMREHGLPYYDAQIWASARLNQVPVIFSEDFQDGQVLEGVRFVNPFGAGFVLDEWV